jgi:hypothetical protein
MTTDTMTTTETTNRIQTQKTLFTRLAQIRDEARVQAHLGRAELMDQIEALEPRWNELKHRLEKAEDATIETGEYVAAAVDLLLDELRAGYDRIRKSF